MRKGSIALLLLLIAGALVAQNVSILLISAPHEHFFVEDMWLCRITNATDSTIEVKLYGTVEHDGELIGRGTSNLISIPHGSKRITSADITDVTDDWWAPEYEDIAERRGALPAGRYLVCVEVQDARTGDRLAHNCRTQEGARPSPPSLIAPDDGSEITTPTPTFVWTPPAPRPDDVTYKLTIVEVPGHMTPEEAIDAAEPWFEKEDIRRTSYPYPMRARTFEESDNFVWKIAAISGGREIGNSEIWTFSLKDRACQCGEWTYLNVAWDGHTESIPPCDGTEGTVFVPPGTYVTVSGVYVCDPPNDPSCPVTYTWESVNLSSHAILASSGGPVAVCDFSFVVTSCCTVILGSYCGGENCDLCHFKVCPEEGDTCQCGDWEDVVVSWTNTSGSSESWTGNCGETLAEPPIIDIGTSIEVNSSVSCIPSPPCEPSDTSWTIITYVGSCSPSSGGTLPISFTPTTIGDNSFTIVLNINCDGTSCACTTNMRVRVVDTIPADTCECGEWTYLNVSWDGHTESIPPCDGTEGTVFVPLGTYVTVSGVYVCDPPNDPSCPVTYTWESVNLSSNAILASSGGPVAVCDFGFVVDTCCTVFVASYCGGENCEQCHFKVCPDTTDTCGVNCCEDFTREVDSLKVTVSPPPRRPYYTLTGLLTAGPAPICKIKAEIVNFSYSAVPPPATNCLYCVWPSSEFGNFGPPVSIGDPVILTTTLTLNPLAPQFNYSREFIWVGTTPSIISGTPFSVRLLLPDASPIIPRCQDTVWTWIRFSFTDTFCVTCDTVIGFWFTRDPLSPITLLSSNENFDENPDIRYGINPEQPTPNRAEENRNFPNALGGGTLVMAMALGVLMTRKKDIARYTRLFMLMALSFLLFPAFSSAQTQVTVTITSDNAYVFGFGDHDEITDYHIGVANCTSGEIYNANIGVETYPNITANIGGYIYILAWSDESGYQGVIAEFTDGNTTILTSPALPNPNVHWEVYATNIDINPPPNYSVPCLFWDGYNYTDIDEPTLADVNDQISDANSGTGLANTSVGWVTTTPSGYVGVLAFGPDNSSAGSPGSPGYPFPPGIVSDIASDAQWMWYNPDPAQITNPFVTGNYPKFPSSMSREYYIFRIGPIDPFFDGGCDNCCDSFEIDVVSNVVHTAAGWWGYYVNSTLTTNHSIIEVKATLVNFYMNNKTGCERCVAEDVRLGSIIPFGTPSEITWPPAIAPTTPPYYNTSPRELVWNNISSGLYLPSLPLNNDQVDIRLVFPEPLPKPGCSDTTWFCIRWSFTDTSCVTCDTLVCYKFTQEWDEPEPPPPDTIKTEKRRGSLNDLPNPENRWLYSQEQNGSEPDDFNYADHNKAIETKPAKGCKCGKK